MCYTCKVYVGGTRLLSLRASGQIHSCLGRKEVYTCEGTGTELEQKVDGEQHSLFETQNNIQLFQFDDNNIITLLTHHTSQEQNGMKALKCKPSAQ